MDRLVVLGAGPKAMAVAAKAYVLRELGLPAPRVTVVEPHAVGGNWLPGGGWTDGRQLLGTSPEKDVGFPYHTRWAPGYNHAIDTEMLAFSWHSFLIAQGTLADWIDRGRPDPEHHQWAKYLQWVAARADVDIVAGAVESLSVRSEGWSIGVRAIDGRELTLTASRLLITGPGPSRRVFDEHSDVLSIGEFWDRVVAGQLPISSATAVIGGGETAASAAAEMLCHDVLSVSVISPAPTIFTRGESVFENGLFSAPDQWRSLSVPDRVEVLRRADRGVFSVSVLERLRGDNRIRHVRGRVVGVRRQDDSVAVTLRNENLPDRHHTFDLVVDATGGQPLWFLDLFDHAARDALAQALGREVTARQVAEAIGSDLSVTGLPVKLYLPNSAALTQGPGFPNLSCLGELSDRILSGRHATEMLAVHSVSKQLRR